MDKNNVYKGILFLIALVALGLSIAGLVKPCSSNFGDSLSDGTRGTLANNESCIPISDSSPVCAYGDKHLLCKNSCVGLDGGLNDNNGTCKDSSWLHPPKKCPSTPNNPNKPQKPVDCTKIYSMKKCSPPCEWSETNNSCGYGGGTAGPLEDCRTQDPNDCDNNSIWKQNHTLFNACEPHDPKCQSGLVCTPPSMKGEDWTCRDGPDPNYPNPPGPPSPANPPSPPSPLVPVRPVIHNTTFIGKHGTNSNDNQGPSSGPNPSPSPTPGPTPSPTPGPSSPPGPPGSQHSLTWLYILIGIVVVILFIVLAVFLSHKSINKK